MTKKIMVLLLVVFLWQCNKKTDAEKAADEYCECMRENNAPQNYVNASWYCNAVLITKYRMYRLDKIDIPYEKYGTPISRLTKDSVSKFYNDFFDLVRQNCCREVMNCGLKEPFKSMSLDSLTKIRKMYPDSDFTK